MTSLWGDCVPVLIIACLIGGVVGGFALLLHFGSKGPNEDPGLWGPIAFLIGTPAFYLVSNTIFWFMRGCWRMLTSTVGAAQHRIEQIAARPEDWHEEAGSVSIVEKK